MRFFFLFFTFSLVILPACTQRQGISFLPARGKIPPRFINIRTDGNVRTLAFEGSHLWLGTPKGLIRYDTDAPLQFQVFTAKSVNEILAKGIFKVAIDNNKIVWIGTYGGGLSRFDGKEWEVFTPYGRGKTTYDRSWTKYLGGEGLGDLWVYDVFFDRDGIVWIATWKGISLFNGKTFKTYTEKDDLLDRWVYAIAKDREGVFWFGTEGGLNRFDGKNWSGYTHKDGLGADIGLDQDQKVQSEHDSSRGHHHRSDKKNKMGNPNYVLDIAVDQNNVKWIGTWGAGLSRFDGKKWTTYTAGNGTIGGNFVHVLEVDPEGNLWAGTDGGVTRFDGKNWKTYTTDDGLLHNDVFSIAFDRKGSKYFGTWTGLSKMIE
ncbi:MAG: two-component regulator propeller domain-containing protein [Nitrospiria bacterium]